jgi:hypothetical protein
VRRSARGSVLLVATVVHGEFEWDDAKAEANEAKHGVTFLEDRLYAERRGQ